MDSNLDPFKNSSKASQKKKAAKEAKNFIESFRDLGSGLAKSAKQDVVKGLGQSLGQQLRPSVEPIQPQRGKLEANQPLNIQQLLEQREKQVRLQERKFAEQRRIEEKTVYSHQEQEIKLEIKALQEELKKVAKTTGSLGQEVEKASFNAVADPGVYHLSFFQRLRGILAKLREKIDESQIWLKNWNQKAEKRGFYWRQVKKSGTKFMLSQERYMSTQAG